MLSCFDIPFHSRRCTSTGDALLFSEKPRRLRLKTWKNTNLFKEAAEVMGLVTEWINEVPLKEELALLRESRELPVPERTVRKATKAGRGDDWSELLEGDELNPWTMAKLKEGYQTMQEDGQRKSW